MLAIYRVIDLTGVFINGILGGTIARRRRFDAIGFGILAILSGLGGGLVRDTFLQKGLPAALAEPIYLGVAIAGAGVAMLVTLERRLWEQVLRIGDGIVLGVWAVTGTIKALSLGLTWPSALLLGMITAVGGGMIRDVTIGVVPAVFGGNTLYATCALLGSGMMIAFHSIGLDSIGMVVSAAAASLLSIVAYYRGWALPSNPDWAPVTMTAGQLRRIMANAQRSAIKSESAGRGSRKGESTKLPRWRRKAERRMTDADRAVLEGIGVDATFGDYTPDDGKNGRHVDSGDSDSGGSAEAAEVKGSRSRRVDDSTSSHSADSVEPSARHSEKRSTERSTGPSSGPSAECSTGPSSGPSSERSAGPSTIPSEERFDGHLSSRVSGRVSQDPSGSPSDRSAGADNSYTDNTGIDERKLGEGNDKEVSATSNNGSDGKPTIDPTVRQRADQSQTDQSQKDSDHDPH